MPIIEEAKARNGCAGKWALPSTSREKKILPRIIIIAGVFVGLPCFISSDSFVCGMIICNLDSNLGVPRSFVLWAYQTRIRDGHFIYCSAWHSKSDANLEYSQIFSSFPLIHAPYPYRRNYNPFRLSFCANETAQRKSKSQLFFKNVTKERCRSS